MTLVQLFSHTTIGDWVILLTLLFTIATAIGTGLHVIALQFAHSGWKKTANGLDGVSVFFVNAIAAVRKFAAMFGVKLEVLTVEQAIYVAEQKAGLSPTSLSPQVQATPRGNAGFIRRNTVMNILAYACLLAFAMAPVMVHGCAGSTTTIGVNGGGGVSPGGNVNWTAGVSIGITVARAALPATQAALDASPAISAQARASIDRGFRIAIDSLPLAETAMNTFAHAPTTANLCLVRFYVEQAITGALQALVVAKDAGAHIDPMIGGALGSLAAIADMLGGNCDTSSAPPMARRTSAQDRVQSVLGASGPVALGEIRGYVALGSGVDLSPVTDSAGLMLWAVGESCR